MRAYFASEIITVEGPLAEAYLLEDQGVITGIVKKPAARVPVTSFENCVLAPGLIDVHTHGAIGYETGFGGRDELFHWAEFQLAHGVTGFLPSTASVPLTTIKKAAEDIKAAMDAGCANILGMQMEGPFFAPGEKIGAQNPRYLQQEFTAAYREFLSAHGGVVKYIAVDPALVSAREIVTFCAGLGIRVAAAHSSILYQDFAPAKIWGFSGITHAFNGMSGLDHRRPGLAYAACMDPDLYAEIICDGYHVSYLMVELLLKLKGSQKSILITDSIAATGMPPGLYNLGGIGVSVGADGKVVKGDGGLAGSTLTLDQAVRNVVSHLRIPLAEAIYMASAAPAAMLGLDGSKGSLGPGKDADFIILDRNLEVAATYMRGKKVYARVKCW